MYFCIIYIFLIASDLVRRLILPSANINPLSLHSFKFILLMIPTQFDNLSMHDTV